MVAITAAAATAATASLLLFGPPVKRTTPLQDRHIPIPPPPVTPPHPLDQSRLSASWSFVDQSTQPSLDAAAHHHAAQVAEQVFQSLADPEQFHPLAAAGLDMLTGTSTGSQTVVVTSRDEGNVRYASLPTGLLPPPGEDILLSGITEDGTIEPPSPSRSPSLQSFSTHLPSQATKIFRWYWIDDISSPSPSTPPSPTRATSLHPSQISPEVLAAGAPKPKTYVMEDTFKILNSTVIVHLTVRLSSPSHPNATSTSVVITPSIRVVGPVATAWWAQRRVVEVVGRSLDAWEGEFGRELREVEEEEEEEGGKGKEAL
ncbi:hypothetical protein HDV00_009638 [Rhizophlyctis rosea]|nr:hypothetical protein HDV00_009638 [Rhizophlyctis rosea]